MRVRFGVILGSLFRMADGLGSGSLLSAAKADDLKAKYPELASDIDLLAESDPTPQKKYLDWSVKMLRTGVDVMEIVETVKKYHKVFDRLRGEDRDVSSFRSLRDMKDATGNVEQKVSKSEAKKKSKKGADILYEDDRWLLVHPTTMDGAIYYGHNTSWCISRRDKKENYFYSPYTMSYNVQFYFLIDKKADVYDEAAASTGGHHFSKLAMLFSDGVPYQKEKFQDAANRKPTEAEVRTAIGSDFDKLYDVAWEHAKKHKETPLYKLANAKNKGDFYRLYEENKEYVDLDEKLGEGPGVLLTVFNLATKVGADDVVFDILSKNYEKDRDYKNDYDFIESVGSYIDEQMVSTPSADFIAKVFELVAKHDKPTKKEFELLEKIVKSPISPIQVIRKIADKYGDYTIIVDAIRESKTASADSEVMSGLANSFDSYARKHAAENENTPIDDLKKLVKDKDVNVALGLASNKSIFKDGGLLRSVLSKKNEGQSLDMPWNMRKTFVTDLINTVLSNSACPDDLFSELMDELWSKEPERRRVENYVYSILDALSSDNVKDGLSTSKLLTILTKVTDGRVDLDLDSLSMRLVSNDSTEPAVFEELYKAIAASLHPSEPSYKKEDALRALGNLAGSPRTPPSVLAKAWKHAPSASKLGIDIDGQLARNPSTPAEIREAIAEQGENMSAKLDAAIERLHAMSVPVNVLLAMEEAAELLSAGNVGGVDRNSAMVVMIPLPKHLAMRFPGVEHNNGHEPHLTVCFLTASEEMTMGKASEALAIIRRICRRQAPFRVALDVNSGLQDFGLSPKGSKALWFDVRQDPNDVLDKLHRAIKNALKLEGLPVEHQNTFHPHVTWRYVANDQSEGERQRMSAFAASRFNDLVSLWFDVKHIIVTMPDRSQRAVALSPRLR
jgi:2'-5' RNA ligase